MHLRKKLAKLLEKEGFHVNPDEIYRPSYSWIKEPVDVLRWEAYGEYNIHSYDTMTDCAKNGITWRADFYNPKLIWVSAKRKIQ